MRIIIDIPNEFEEDYTWDRFKDFFSRVLCDIQDGTICGNYEKETAEMFLKAFDESIPMDKIVEQLQQAESVKCYGSRNSGNYMIPLADAIEIVKAGGVE